SPDPSRTRLRRRAAAERASARRPTTTGCAPLRFASLTDFPQTSSRASFRSLLCRRLIGDPVANHVDAPVSFLNLLFGTAFGRRVDIGDAAQRECQRAALACARQRLGLLGLQFERDGAADEGVDALF